MPHLLHKPTAELLRSARAQVAAADPENFVRITNEQLESWGRIPLRYRKVVGDIVKEMSVAEKAAVDSVAEREAEARALCLVQQELPAMHAARGRLEASGGPSGLVDLQIKALEEKASLFGPGVPTISSATQTLRLEGPNVATLPIIPAGAICLGVRTEVLKRVLTSTGRSLYDVSHADALGVEFGEDLPGELGSVSSNAQHTKNPTLLWHVHRGRPAPASIFIVAQEPDSFVDGVVRVTAYFLRAGE